MNHEELIKQLEDMFKAFIESIKQGKAMGYEMSESMEESEDEDEIEDLGIGPGPLMSLPKEVALDGYKEEQMISKNLKPYGSLGKGVQICIDLKVGE